MQGDIEREYCNLCVSYTNQEVIGYNHQVKIDENVNCPEHFIHEMLRCRGCDTVIMRFTDHIEFEDMTPSVHYYPPKEQGRRHRPEWAGKDIPLRVYLLMHEVYSAVEYNLLRLAAMGIRAALENVMKEKVGDRPFRVLVDEFQKAGYLSTRQALNLDTIIEAGHATIHRSWVPTQEDVDTLLDITESLIEMVYLHEDRARALDQRVPRREKPVSNDQSSGKKTRDV